MLELRVCDLVAGYGKGSVLRGLSLTVPAGSVTALLGRNGVGKSTTVKTIMGVVRAKHGSVQFGGKTITGLASHEIGRLGISLVPQGRRIFQSLTVEENLTISFGARHREGKWTLNRVFSIFPELKDRRKDPAAALSGGQQSALSIGRGLMANGQVILMDEPSEGLSPILVDRLCQVIDELRDEGCSVLLVEQNLALAAQVANTAYVIASGKAAYEGSATSLLNDSGEKQRLLGGGSG